MDVIFNCQHCNQELSVDSSGAGSEIECPSCGGRIVIPQEGGDAPREPRIVNAMAASAAAKEEKHFSVPVHEKRAESLITKPLPPLEVAAKEAIQLHVKTIRHSDCIEVGHDRFDEIVTKFLGKIGEAHLVSITALTYTHQELASRAWITDYGVMIVYKG
jgi:DNA-directed RNA polymerase subunit RPC12/RpoP